VNTSDEAETEALLPIPASTGFLWVGQGYPMLPQVMLPDELWCLSYSCSIVLGAVACVVTQYVLCGTSSFFRSGSSAAANLPVHDDEVTALAPPYVGSTEVHHFPPTKPTNAFPSLFPTNIGYAGGTPTEQNLPSSLLHLHIQFTVVNVLNN